jgi:hypothetical protein
VIQIFGIFDIDNINRMAINRNKDSKPVYIALKPKKQEDSTKPALMSFYGKLKGVFGDGCSTNVKLEMNEVDCFDICVVK